MMPGLVRVVVPNPRDAERARARAVAVRLSEALGATYALVVTAGGFRGVPCNYVNWHNREYPEDLWLVLETIRPQ